MCNRAARYSAVLLLGTMSNSAAAQAETLKLTIRAFIPSTVSDNPGYVKTIKDSSGQSVSVLESPNPLENICYLTDQRGFSVAESATSRLALVGAFSVSGATPALITDLSDTGTTHAANCATGASQCVLKASKSEVKWGTPTKSGTTISFPFDAKAANPCIEPAAVAPKIFISGNVLFNTATGDIAITGKGSKFPSLEAFAIYEVSPPTPIMKLEASGTVLNIPVTRDLKGSASLPIYDGIWTSDDPGRRFTLQITGRTARFIERSAGGTTLERQVPLRVDKGGLLTGYRENDAETLRFLDFGPDMIAQIQSRGAQPSHFTIERTSGAITLTWAGLLVTKDAKGNLKDIRQPGSGPIKTYTLKKS